MNLEKQLKQSIRDIKDFPKEGIIFKDITPLLADPVLFKAAVDALALKFKDSGINKIVSIEARGFIFGSALAYAMGVGFVPVRKKGKLPYKTIEASFALEYANATVQIHADALNDGDKVLIVDDLLATGGTVSAALKLIRQLGASPVACAVIIELAFLGGRDKIDVPVEALIKY